MNHAAKLRRAFDTLPVDLRHYVVFLQAGFCAGLSGNIFPSTTAAFGGELLAPWLCPPFTSCVSTPSSSKPSSR